MPPSENETVEGTSTIGRVLRSMDQNRKSGGTGTCRSTTRQGLSVDKKKVAEAETKPTEDEDEAKDDDEDIELMTLEELIKIRGTPYSLWLKFQLWFRHLIKPLT